VWFVYSVVVSSSHKRSVCCCVLRKECRDSWSLMSSRIVKAHEERGGKERRDQGWPGIIRIVGYYGVHIRSVVFQIITCRKGLSSRSTRERECDGVGRSLPVASVEGV